MEISVRITNPTGLHARPAVKLAQLAAGFKADVQVRIDEQANWVGARSTSRLMKLKARHNATIHFKAEGEDADQALNALVDLVQRNFDESDAPPALASTVHNAEQPHPVVSAADGIRITGDSTSEGIAIGVLKMLITPADVPADYHRATPSEELNRFQLAVASAREELRQLSYNHGETAAEVIGFQLALLDDPEFLDPVHTAIKDGQNAPQAWAAQIKQEADGYRGTSDTYFRERAADYQDLGDRVLRGLRGERSGNEQLAHNSIIVTDQLTPSRFLEINWACCSGVVMLSGSQASHVAMLARAKGVPMLTQAQGPLEVLRDGDPAVLDSTSTIGQLIVNPNTACLNHYRQQIEQRVQHTKQAQAQLAAPAVTANGTPITLLLNVDHPAVLEGVNPEHCDGVGLTRTEFLFETESGLPSEQQQYESYRQLIEWACGKTVTIRTLDAGGDKPITGVDSSELSHDFLGLRGLRLSLAQQQIFKPQLRALARAAVHGPLRVMLPMVTLPSEFAAAKSLMQQAISELKQANYAAAMPEFGMMVEVPAAALNITAFEADFFSIGSNDLTQYTLAVARDDAKVASLYDARHPAVLELIARVVEHGQKIGVPVSLCGEISVTHEHLKSLLATGLTALSVPPAMLGNIKLALAQV